MVRIASLQPSITLTLGELGQLDALCAVTKYCMEALPELAERVASGRLVVLNDSWTADTAQIVAARPELVIASVPYRMESLAAILKAGLPVLALAPRSLADVYADMRLIASVVRADAEPVIARMESAIEAARKRAAGLREDERPRVYCEEWGRPMIHSQRWVAELVEAAGGRFVGVPGEHTTAEAVAEAAPDVMLFAWCGAGDRVPLAKVVAQREWGAMRAVRGGHVHCVPDQYFNTPATTLLGGLACIEEALRPWLPAREMDDVVKWTGMLSLPASVGNDGRTILREGNEIDV